MGEFPSQKPMTRSFHVFFDLRLNKRLCKQTRFLWYETPTHSLWRHYNAGLVHVMIRWLFEATSLLQPMPITIQYHQFYSEYALVRKMSAKCVQDAVCPKGLHLIQYIPRNVHTIFALLCFDVVIHWLIFPYPSGLLHWHCGNLTIAPVPAKQPWWIWINTSCEFIMNDCITTTKQSTTKPWAYFLGYTVYRIDSHQARVAAGIAQLYGNDGQSVRHTGIFVPGQAEVC